MPNPNVLFNGQSIILPGGYTAIDASQLAPGSFGLANVIAILGEAEGGKPGVPLYFRSAETAKRVLRGGDLLEGIIMAYDPNGLPDRPGADVIIAIRVDPATQSTLALAGGSGTSITLTSRDYGSWTTGIEVKVATGTSSGKKVTVKYVDALLGEIVEVFDNLASRAAIIAAINGGINGGQSASAFVTAAAGTDTTSPVNVGYVPLAGGVDGVTASATAATLALLGATGVNFTLTSIGAGAWNNNILAKVEAGSITGNKVTIQYPGDHLTTTEVFDNLADAAAVVSAINGVSVLVTAAAGPDSGSPNNAAYTNLSGGLDATSATTSSHWANALNALALEDCDFVVPVTNDPVITALVKTHVDTLSGVKARKERVAIVGAALASGFGTTADYVADCVSKASDLASSRVQLVAPGIKRPNKDGVVTSFGPQFLACIVAGLTASLEVGESATHKYVKAVGLDAAFTPDDQENLLLGGASPVEFVKGDGFRVVQAITTYQVDANPIYREMSVRRVGDFLMRNIRQRLDHDFVGTRGDATTLQAMLDTTVSVLERMEADRVITGYQNVKITIASGIARVTFEFAPSEPVNYALITGFAKPGSLSVTFTGQASYSGATPS